MRRLVADLRGCERCDLGFYSVAGYFRLGFSAESPLPEGAKPSFGNLDESSSGC